VGSWDVGPFDWGTSTDPESGWSAEIDSALAAF
jgi:hypothetical protein